MVYSKIIFFLKGRSMENQPTITLQNGKGGDGCTIVLIIS